MAKVIKVWSGSEWVDVGVQAALPSNYVITSSLASTIGLIIKGAASQTANLQQWQNSSGTILSAIDTAGNFTKGDGDQMVLAAQIYG